MIKVPINNTPFNTTNNSLSCSFENENFLLTNTKKIFSSELLIKLNNIVNENNLDIKSKNPIKRIRSDELILNLENEK
jgi:hypothetical protein